MLYLLKPRSEPLLYIFVVDVLPGSGENYIYYIGAFKKFAPNIILLIRKIMNLMLTSFSCAAFSSALLQKEFLFQSTFIFHFSLIC